jgi:hypothetical protein
MKLSFDARRYGQRSQLETVVSVIKSRQGQAARCRSFQDRCRDLRRMTIAPNVMILWRRGGFLESYSLRFVLQANPIQPHSRATDDVFVVMEAVHRHGAKIAKKLGRPVQGKTLARISRLLV